MIATLNDLKIKEYSITTDIALINMGNLPNLPDRWAVKRFSSGALSKKTFDFEYEPLPSSRTDEYLEEHRFSSPQEALDAYNEYLKKRN